MSSAGAAFADAPLDGRRRPPGAGSKAILLELGVHMRRDRISVVAGSLAYHGFLALFPAVIAALGILSLAHAGTGTLHHLVHAVDKALPAGASGVFEGAVRAASKRNGGTAAVVLGGLIALWSATSATAVLQQALDVVHEMPTDRSFLARRLRGLPLLALTVVLGTLAAALVVLGQPIGEAIRGALPLGAAGFTVSWTVFRWFVAFVAISTLFSSYYALGPNREQVRWRWVTPGSLLATAAFLASSLGFSFYISTFGSYARTYGSFAGVAILIFWLYLTSLAVLVGSELNVELERRRGEGATSAAAAGGEPGGGQPGGVQPDSTG